eukprot:31559-Pelagococcus_subviridis.AAC.3
MLCPKALLERALAPPAVRLDDRTRVFAPGKQPRDDALRSFTHDFNRREVVAHVHRRRPTILRRRLLLTELPLVIPSPALDRAIAQERARMFKSRHDLNRFHARPEVHGGNFVALDKVRAYFTDVRADAELPCAHPPTIGFASGIGVSTATDSNTSSLLRKRPVTLNFGISLGQLPDASCSWYPLGVPEYVTRAKSFSEETLPSTVTTRFVSGALQTSSLDASAAAEPRRTRDVLTPTLSVPCRAVERPYAVINADQVPSPSSPFSSGGSDASSTPSGQSCAVRAMISRISAAGSDLACASSNSEVAT